MKLVSLATAALLVIPAVARGEFVFHYRFEDGPDGDQVMTLVDSSPNGLNGTATGLVYSDDVAGPSAGNFSADATGDFNYGEVANNAAMHLQEFTLRALARPEEPYGTAGGEVPHYIVIKKFGETGTGLSSFGIAYNPTTDRFTASVSFGFGQNLSIETESLFGGGQWYSLALSLDRDVSGNTDRLMLFVDGQLRASIDSELGAIAYSSEELVIGAANLTSSSTGSFRRNFNGLIDEVSLSPTPIPEPSTAVLLGLGLLVFAVLLPRRSLRHKDSR